MNVLLLSTEMPPLFRGGLGSYTLQVANRLGRQKNKVKLIVLLEGTDYSILQSDEMISNQSMAAPNIELHFIDNMNEIIEEIMTEELISVGRLEELFSSDILKSIQDYDLVHCNDWFTALFGAYIKFRYDIPLVFSVHLPVYAGFTYSTHIPPLDTKRRLEYLGLRCADAIIVASNFTKEIVLSTYNIDEKKIRTIPIGIDTTFFSGPAGKPKGERDVLFISRLAEQKGIDYLLDFLEVSNELRGNVRFSELIFRIVGTGPAAKDIIKKIHENNLDNVKLLGFIPSQQDLKDLYLNSYLFLITSIFEPFGIVALEAMACGLPILGFDVGGLGEIIRNNKDGILVPPGDVPALYNAFAELIANPGLVSQMSANARNRAQDFDLSIHLNRLLAVYSEVTADR